MSLIGRINNNLKLTTMRKFLRLSLVCLMAMVGMYAYADTYSYTFEKSTFNASEETQSLNNVDWTLITDGGFFGYDGAATDRGQQIGSKSKPATTLELSTTGIIGTITSIKINTSGASKINATLDVTVGGKAFGKQYTLTSKNAEATFTGSASGEIKLNYANSSAAAIYIKSIEVTYELSEDDVVAPTISGETTFEGSTEVTITGGDGTTIYYTTDGTDPTTATTTKGTSPVKFTIDKSTTVKAIAEKNGNVSTVASKEFTKVEFADMTIADLYKLDAPQENINLTINDGKVVHVNGTDVYVRDGEYAILFYHTNKLKLNKNATVSGTVKVDFTIHNGLYEVKENNFTNTSALKIEDSKEEALPLNATIQDIATDGKYMNNLVKIENVKITSEVSGKYTNYYATNGTDKIQLYGADDVVEKYANDETEYNITAVVSMYNKAQLLPVSVETATGITDVTVDEFDENAPIYNLSGQRVDKSAKGILIQNGKKFIRR